MIKVQLDCLIVQTFHKYIEIKLAEKNYAGMSSIANTNPKINIAVLLAALLATLPTNCQVYVLTSSKCRNG